MDRDTALQQHIFHLERNMDVYKKHAVEALAKAIGYGYATEWGCTSYEEFEEAWPVQGNSPFKVRCIEEATGRLEG